MTGSLPSESSEFQDRLLEVQRVLDLCVERRLAGENLTDQQIVAEYSRLMPELGEELSNLRVIERARRLACKDVGPVSATQTAGSGEPARGYPGRQSIEGYEILSEIHRGGQGVVYKAVQKATKRTVALKVMLEGPYASARQRHRFEREIDLAAGLQHPNIVTIYDSGVTADGSHYFVMAYIRGHSLSEYVSKNKPTIDQTLLLFQKICAAVNYAHQRGVIHRDLKPSNIRIDAAGEPHLLDFGLARAAGMGMSEGGPVTITGEFMGTLAYASPEQTRGDTNQIDIRTDVYSLGVILFEMLTAKYPYEVVGQMADVLRNIAEAEPRKPSTIHRQINDEVETIVLKALAKERERRYQSADALAKDIEHYLSGEAIEAKRDSAFYVLRKTLRRYRVPAAVGAAFVVVVICGLVLSVAFWRRAVIARESEADQRRLANDARIAESEQRRLAELQRDLALAAEELAETRRKEAEFHAYVANIGAADAFLRANDVVAANYRLKLCPNELRNWEWHHLYSRTDMSLASFKAYSSWAFAVAYSPDGTRLATGGSPDHVSIWDAALGTELMRLQGHNNLVLAVAFSPDGKRLASGSQDQAVKVWDVESGDELLSLSVQANSVDEVAFSPDGKQLAFVGSNKLVRVWDLSRGDSVATLKTREAASLAFSPDGSMLATGGRDGIVSLWDLPRRSEVASFRGYEALVSSVAFDSSGERLAGASRAPHAVKVWNVERGEEVLAIRGRRFQIADVTVAFSPDDKHLAMTDGDRTIKLWDLSQGEKVLTLRGHTAEIWDVSFSPDGRRLVSADDDGIIKFWDPRPREEVLTIRGVYGRALAFSPDGTLLAGASRDHSVKIWKATSGQEILTLRGHTALVMAVEFRPDGTQLVSASLDQTLRVWDIREGKEVLTLRGHTESVWGVTYSPNGRMLASRAGETVKLWDAQGGDELRTIATEVQRLTFSSDGARLITARSAAAQHWDLASGEKIAGAPAGHDSQGRAIAMSPDGTRLATARYGTSAELWDTATGEHVLSLPGHTDAVADVAFSPDGTRLATAADDHTIKLWDAIRGEELLTLRGHAGSVYEVRFSPQGDRLASISKDGTIKVWDTVAPGIRAAMPAQAVVDSLLEQLSTPAAVLDRLRSRASMSPEEREAAEVALLRRSIELNAQAGPLIESLFDELGFTEDVIERLQRNESLSVLVRAVAIRRARAQGDDANTLNSSAWRIVKIPGAARDICQRALRMAEAASKAEPGDANLLNTLGVAQYRVGMFEEALATLKQSDELHSRRQTGGHSADLAFLAMALHQLGQVGAARTTLERLRTLMQHERWQDDEEAHAFHAEVEALLGATASKRIP